MAFSRRLGEGWTLTDGVIGPFLLERPMDALSALRAQGIIPRAAGGSALLQQEWTKLRTFTYALRFDAPEEGDELASLHIPHLAGAGIARLNGGELGRFDGEAALLPLDRLLRDGSNVLELAFEPDPRGGARGILGDVFLRTGNYLRATRGWFDGRGSAIAATVDVEPLTSGKYLFRYTVALDDRAVLSAEHIERLRACQPARVRHELPIQNPVHWDAANPDGASYVVKLSIERMGVGCDTLMAQVALLPDGYAPARIARLHPALLCPADARERNLAAVRELGAEAVVASSGAALLPENLLPHGLLTLEGAPVRPLPVERALAPLDALRALGGDWDFWPTDGPLFRWFGLQPIDESQWESLFGVNAAGDAGRCVRLSRLMQAELLYRSICEARLAGEPTLLDQPIELSPAPMSAALIEAGGAERPACAAVEAAWSNLVAYAQLPEPLAAACGAEIELPVHLINAGAARPLSVTIGCFGPDERQKLATAGFESGPPGRSELGALRVRMPGAPQVLTVRCEIQSGGALLWRHDSLLCACEPGGPPLAALMKS